MLCSDEDVEVRAPSLQLEEILTLIYCGCDVENLVEVGEIAVTADRFFTGTTGATEQSTMPR